MYNILKDQLRIAWSDLEPLIISKEEELLTIHIKVNNNFSVDDVAGFSLNTESELASPIGERLGTKQLSLPLLKHADALTRSANIWAP